MCELALKSVVGRWSVVNISTLENIVADFGDNLSPKTATVAEFGDYSRQCGQAITLISYTPLPLCWEHSARGVKIGYNLLNHMHNSSTGLLRFLQHIR